MSVGRLIRWLIGLLLVLFGVGVVAVLVLVATSPTPREAAGWNLAAPMPVARGETASAVSEGRLFVVGGLGGALPATLDRVTVYDPASDSWSSLAALPAARHHAAAVGLAGSVYVSGGVASLTDWSPRADFWQLPGEGADWLELPSMPEPRFGHRMVALDGHVYVVGGQGGSGATLIFDPSAGSWRSGAPLPATRDHLAVVVLGGEIWAIGGRNGGPTARVEIYDPASNAWRGGPELPAVTSGASEAASEALVLISGGEDPHPGGAGVFDRHWWLDAGDQSAGWRELPAPPLAVHGAQGALIDGRFYVPGGATRAGALSFLSFADALQVFEVDTLGPTERPIGRGRKPGGAGDPLPDICSAGQR